MSSLAPPSIPQYRITLFFGPESLDDDSDALQCVFNVKKRSWKAGIQVAVHLSPSLIASVRDQLGFTAWLESSWTPVPDTDRAALRTRSDDALVVELARTKLEDALDRGVPQENQVLGVDAADERLVQIACREEATIKSRLRAELDLSSD